MRKAIFETVNNVMIANPLVKNLHRNIYDKILLSLVCIIYVTLCAEADMFVPAFPEMIEYFGINENKIQLILSINFVSLSVTGLIAGPLSDAYGRRRVLLLGLFLLVLSSIGCVLSDNFYYMLVWRILQGMSAAFPMGLSI